jgi:lysophospholipase L1-like esterase
MIHSVFLLGIAQTTCAATTPTDRMATDWWATRHASYVARTQKNDFKLAFLGDSITQGWESSGKATWDAEIAPFGAANFGVSGDRTQHVLWRLDNGELLGTNVKLVVLMIGTNHAGIADEPASDVAAGVRAIVDRLLSRTPARVLILAIFPRDQQPTAKVRQKNIAVNALLAPMADGKRVFFADINSRFLHADSTLRTLYLPDRLHLSPAGYRLWANGVVPEIKRLMP